MNVCKKCTRVVIIIKIDPLTNTPDAFDRLTANCFHRQNVHDFMSNIVPNTQND